MQAVDIVIGVGWVVFWIYWIAASVGVKAGRTRWARFAGVRVAVILAVLLLLRLRGLKGHHAVTDDPWLQGIGLAIFLLGLVTTGPGGDLVVLEGHARLTASFGGVRDAAARGVVRRPG